jgi:tryptophan synthase alpha chain
MAKNMDRIAKAFQEGKPFIGYLTGGDGGVEYSVDSALALIDGGVNILEIGLPFSDPVADGPVIQRAHERALSGGANSYTVLEIARRLRKRTDIPLLLFSYYNPILKKGNSYLHQLKAAGFDAVLIVDLAVSGNSADAEPFFKALKEAKLLPILLATPSTSPERLQLISQVGKGFIYHVCQKGTTGVRSKLPEDLSFHNSRIRETTSLPVAAGFGIADRDNSRAALESADAFVVGSAFVKLMEERRGPAELKALAEAIRPLL